MISKAKQKHCVNFLRLAERLRKRLTWNGISILFDNKIDFKSSMLQYSNLYLMKKNNCLKADRMVASSAPSSEGRPLRELI